MSVDGKIRRRRRACASPRSSPTHANAVRLRVSANDRFSCTPGIRLDQNVRNVRSASRNREGGREIDEKERERKREDYRGTSATTYFHDARKTFCEELRRSLVRERRRERERKRMMKVQRVSGAYYIAQFISL